MTPRDPTPLEPDVILTSRRHGVAINALPDTTGHPDRSAVHRDQRDRHAIRQALNRSSHPLAPAAHGLPDQCDELANDNRTAGLLLFAQITRSTERQRDTAPGVQR